MHVPGMEWQGATGLTRSRVNKEGENPLEDMHETI